jgi:hypothetical protein
MSGNDFSEIFARTAQAAGIDLKASKAEVQQYANAQLAALSTLNPGEPGYDDAVKARALAVAIHAANATVDQGDAADARLAAVAFALLTAALG